MDQDEGILQQLQQGAGEDRTLPPEVLQDEINEKAEYEKELLQGAGGLMVGNTVEKALKGIAKGNKGKAVLKKLGLSDEDVDTIVSAIKSRDSGALTDFLARKGTGYAENIAKQVGKRGTKLARTSAKALKEGRVPTREEISNSLLEGNGSEVKPTKSNRSGRAINDDEAEGVDTQEGSIFDSLINRGKTALRSTTETLENTIGDIPSQVSSQASRVSSDIRGVVRGAEDSVRNPLSKANSVFSRARAEFSGEGDLAGQSEAVKKLLSKSKAGRKLIRRNAKARAEGRNPEKAPANQPKTEFDEADADGDFLSELISKRKAPKGKSIDQINREGGGEADLPNEPIEVDALTGRPVLNPSEKVAQARAKLDEDFKKITEQNEIEGERDPYQDVYDEAKRVSERFTPKELGKPVSKTEVDFKYKAPTEEEHKATLKAQEQEKPEPMLKTDEEDPDLQGAWDDDELVSRVVQTEAPRISVPPSQQTQGLDPSKLPEDASYQRGSQRIQAKREVEPPKEPEQVAESDIPKPAEEEEVQPVQAELRETQLQTVQVRQQAQQQTEQLQQSQQQQTEEKAEVQSQQEQSTIKEQDNPASQPKSKLNPDEELNTDAKLEQGTSKATKVEDGLKGAFEDSLAEDDNPFGIVLTGILGIGALIGGIFKKAHHPHFVQPPALHPYESFSVQEGVA